ncbi:T9SS type A sorting domain-containing protein [Flavobacteriales bacterium]|nr:T9SS type A sorting domain-containing protein [Flavobacteriales bacterium]
MIIKKQLLSLVVILLTGNIYAQITVTSTDIIDAGDVIYEALDSISGSSIQVGPAGANQIWDFSNLQSNEVNIIEHVDPNSTYFGFMYPTSNICTLEDSEAFYINKSSNGVQMLGVDDNQFFNPITLLPLPLTYPMQFSTGEILVINQVEEMSFLPDSLAILMTFGAAHTIDSINIQVTIESTFNVDGYGDVVIPMGTFPALRLSSIASNTQTYSFYCTDTIFGVNSGWYPAPQQLQQLFPTETNTDYAYQWWSNDPAVKFALVNIDVDEYGYNDGKIQFLTNTTMSVGEQNDLEVSVFPVPATYSLTIEAKFNEFADLDLVDVNGRTVFNQQFYQKTNLDLSKIAKGVYYLSLSTSEGRLTKKIIVE